MWSLPESWDPGGLRLSATDLAELLRLLARMPRSRVRDVILAKLTTRIRQANKPSLGGELADEYFVLFTQAAKAREALDVLFYSRETGLPEIRTISVQESGADRGACWVVSYPFNTASRMLLDSVLDLRQRPDRPYMPADVLPKRSDLLPKLWVSFSVPQAKARALLSVLPAGLTIRHAEDRVHAEGQVTALTPVARAVLALGAGTEVATPELRGLVQALARIALGELSFETLHRA
ncbi:MAG: hypothetical protein U1E65_22075 [Myxococcota bacterium]